MDQPMCRNGLHPATERYHDGEKWRCRPCRTTERQRSQARYAGTAKGMLTGMRYDARRRGES